MFMPRQVDAFTSKEDKFKIEQSQLKKKRADILKKIEQEKGYEPVLKLEHGAYTREEWECVLAHSKIDIFDVGLAI